MIPATPLRMVTLPSSRGGNQLMLPGPQAARLPDHRTQTPGKRNAEPLVDKHGKHHPGHPQKTLPRNMDALQMIRIDRDIGIRQADLQRISPVARIVHGQQKRILRRSRQVLDDGPAPSPEGFDDRHRMLPAPGELRRSRKLLLADLLLVRVEPADQFVMVMSPGPPGNAPDPGP